MSSEAVWKLGRLNHVAVATPDLAKTSAFYRDVLGAKVVTQAFFFNVFAKTQLRKKLNFCPPGKNSKPFLSKNST